MSALTLPTRWQRAGVLIRPMDAADVPAAAALDQRIRDAAAWSEAVLRGEQATADRRYVLAEDAGGEVLGFAGAMRVLDEVHVTTMGVSPARRRGGLATQLLRVLLLGAVREGASAATLEVATGNEPAIALYRRFGFAPVGVRPGYYATTGEDALIMWAHAIDTVDYRTRLADLRGDWEVTG